MLVLLITLVLIAGLFLRPRLALDVLWFILIPILPVTFLINAGLWRGICPLATANDLGPSDRGRMLARNWINPAAAVGIVLLFVLVPGRHLVFNQQGPALAVVILAVTVLAAVLGFVFRAKSGFCNSICPVLPVEKLYGQAPLMAVRNPRCVPCNLCTAKGCLDIDPSISVKTAVGNGEGVSGWIRTPFGVFAASFPGFVFGYFQVSDAPLAAWLSVYGTILGYALGSFAIVTLLSFLLKIPTHRLMPFLGALAVGIYYWYAAPASMAAFDLPGGIVLRWALLAFVAFWLLRALFRPGEHAAPQRPAGAHPVTPHFPLGGPAR